jgi:putative transposase
MLPEWLMAMLVLLKERWSTRRDAHVRFLKLQVEILRSRLPGNRAIPDPVEQRRLPNAGAEGGHAVQDTLGIVSIKTYRRWLREGRGGRDPGKVGRPRVLPESLRQLIVRLAGESAGWGVRRIVGELRKPAREGRSRLRAAGPRQRGQPYRPDSPADETGRAAGWFAGPLSRGI